MLSVRDVRRFPLSCGSGLFRISRGDMTLKCPRQNTGKYNFKYAGKKSIPDLRLSFQAIQLSSSCTMFYPCVPCETCEVHAPRTPCGQYWPQLDMLHSPSGFPFRISRGTTGCGLRRIMPLPAACSQRYFYRPRAANEPLLRAHC